MIPKIVSVFVLTLALSSSLRAQELLSNPSLVLSIDEALGERVFGKIGNLESILKEMKPEEVKAQIIKARQAALETEREKGLLKVNSADFFMIKFWEGREDAKVQSIQIAQVPREVNKGYFKFNLQNYSQYIYTKFEALKRGKTYQITIAYNFTNEVKLASSEALNIFMTEDSPEEAKDLKALFDLPFISNQKAKIADEKRRKIINDYQKNYGGVFSEDFAQKEAVKTYFEKQFLYKAKGGEQFLTIGRIYSAQKKRKSNLSENLECNIYMVSLQPVYSTVDDER